MLFLRCLRDEISICIEPDLMAPTVVLFNIELNTRRLNLLLKQQMQDEQHSHNFCKKNVTVNRTKTHRIKIF